MSMYRSIKIIVLLIISIGYINSICTDTVCCDDTCYNCPNCTGILKIDELCCNVTIMNSNHSCDIYNPPCIVVHNDTITNTTMSTNTLTNSNNSDFFTMVNIIMLSVAFVVFCFLIYVCCFFDKRKPPVKYDDLFIPIPK